MIRQFQSQKTQIEGLILLKPFVAWDERGYFIKDYSQETLTQHGIDHALKEVFYTVSHKSVIRGIHFQREKQQAKLVRCIMGKVYDVIVDLREGSPTFGKWQAFILSEENMDELYIPGGCGHGYLVLEPAIVTYKCNEKFFNEYDDGIIWDDPDISIKWPMDEVDQLIISEKDKSLQTFKQFKEKYSGFV